MGHTPKILTIPFSLVQDWLCKWFKIKFMVGKNKINNLHDLPILSSYAFMGGFNGNLIV